MSSRRKLIDKNEDKVSFVQLIGFFLILAGVGYIFLCLYGLLHFEGSGIAFDFFIIMLGFAFAFPDLLQDQNNGLSTMRIAVFMMINVICMLLLKLGWDHKNLSEISLDQYWMGVIAFVFGAKATQSFFESKMAALTPAKQPALRAFGNPALSGGSLARLAIIQNEQVLKSQFLNITSLSDSVDDLRADDSHVVAIYLKDDNTRGLPSTLTATMPDGTAQKVRTEIVSGVGTGIIHISQTNDNVSDNQNPDYLGSICCMVKSSTDPTFRGLLTSGHIYSNGYLEDNKGVLSKAKQGTALVDKVNSGKWYLQTINNTQDLAVIRLDADPGTDAAYQSFSSGYYTVGDKDVKTNDPNITMISKGSKIRDAYILDYNLGFDLQYHTASNFVKNIILVGSTPSRDDSNSLSEEGDSGSPVYHKATGKLIGMLLGGNAKFSFVLPVESTLRQFNLQPI